MESGNNSEIVIEGQNNTQKAPRTINLDTALEEAGGLGRFQVVFTIALALWRTSGMWCFYMFAYLSLQQKYLCRQPAGESIAGEPLSTDEWY